jgi:mRNA-degrading endonuclease RelE of RelBE toxin-antitoxin system
MREKPERGKALVGELAGWQSWRVGRMRIIYRVRKSEIEVAAIGPRASIYLETARELRRTDDKR